MLEFETYLRFLMSLGVVLALIGAGAWAIKRFALERGLPVGRRDARRLQVMETLSLDARRKLVLLRRDGIEHLVLFGPNQELLVESGITRAAELPTQMTQSPGMHPTASTATRSDGTVATI